MQLLLVDIILPSVCIYSVASDETKNLAKPDIREYKVQYIYFCDFYEV